MLSTCEATSFIGPILRVAPLWTQKHDLRFQQSVSLGYWKISNGLLFHWMEHLGILGVKLKGESKTMVIYWQ